MQDKTTVAPEAMAKVVAAPVPVALFQGYDSVTGRGLGTVLTGTSKKSGGTSSVTYRVCTDLETLSDTLEIDQSLSIGFGPIGGIDQKMKFVHSLDVTTYSVSIVVYARHVESTETATSTRLQNGTKPPAGDAQLRDFFRVYGDAFLASVTHGGEYYAVYTYYSQTREEQTQLTLDMKAHGIFEGGKVDAGLQTKLSSFNSSVKTRVSFAQNISGILNPKFPDSEHIISFALEFPSIPLDSPAIVGFDTSGYEHVDKFGDFEPIAKNRAFFVGDSVIGGLTEPLVRIQELQNQIAWVEGVYRSYGGFADSKLADVGAQAKKDHDRINDLIRDFEKDPVQSFSQPDLPSLKSGTPMLKYTITRSDAHGGGGGSPFDDVDVNTSIPQQTRITGLQLRSGKRVDKLLVTYQNTSSSWTVEHGGNGGDLGNKVTLMAGQYVNGIGGRSGSRVDHLTLTTSNGDKVDGGRDGGSEFSEKIPSGAFLLGFAGRNGSELDRIQFVYGKLEPAVWEPARQR